MHDDGQPASADAPYDGLTPDSILDALAEVGLMPDGRMFALNSYENRVYQVGVEDSAPVVAKFYRPGRWSDTQIVEEHSFTAELAAAEIPVIAPLEIEGRTLHAFERWHFAVFPRCAGRVPAIDHDDTLEWMGRFLGRIHAVGAQRPFMARPALDIDTFGVQSRDWLLEHDFIPPDLLPAWRSVADAALDGVRRCYDRAGDVSLLRLHGDCHASNVLWIEEADAKQGDPLQKGDSLRSAGPHFVDFDDSRTGPAVQDLWMLLSGDRASMQSQLASLLAGYEDFCEFDTRELYLVEALRTLRLLHYSAWLARRWNDPAFPAAFPWFNTQRYWQDRVLELREQIALLDEPPLW
ncbi:Serine/threonine protein kinase RdoA [Ralstonia sp. LMG 32965]|uniref:serine/threonine protein kinase n=1 Tax=Ralstonia flatus TaxID=3058601 RepID=UPI0028F567AE|nr:serine/threonine protein kinase [Ralstonia sp. LMG 32965]CAJ0873130.1 Serine/threonine protein kinase RdoA [Ralstonia sp. LMG 32965]